MSFVRIDGKDDHTRPRAASRELLKDLEAPHSRHDQVEHDDVAVKFLIQRKHLRAFRSPHHLEVSLPSEHCPNTFAYDRVILRKQHLHADPPEPLRTRPEPRFRLGTPSRSG